MRFLPVEHSICRILGTVGPIDVKQKEMSQLDAMLTRVLLTSNFDLDLWPWIFKVKLYLGNGRPDCHGTKGTGVDRMPWCEILRKWVSWTLHWLGYLSPWRLTFKVKLYHGNGRPDGHGTRGTGADRMNWCEILREWVNWTGAYLTLTVDLQGQIISREWEARSPWDTKGWESIGCPDVKHSHYVTSRQRILLGTGVT